MSNAKLPAPTMTKAEAIEAMKRGEKVTHRYFTSEEWVTEKNGRIVFEDGCSCTPHEFWSFRTEIAFESDWSLWAGAEATTKPDYLNKTLRECSREELMEALRVTEEKNKAIDAKSRISPEALNVRAGAEATGKSDELTMNKFVDKYLTYAYSRQHTGDMWTLTLEKVWKEVIEPLLSNKKA